MTEIAINKNQDVWAEFSTLPKPPIVLHRYDHRKLRFYWYQQPENGQMATKTAIGITSLLSLVMPTSPFLTKWKLDRADTWEDELDSASEYGTLLHMSYGEWLVNRHIPTELIEAARDVAVKAGMGYDMIDKDVLSFLAFVEQYNIKPMLVEAMLLSEPVNGQSYALTLDLLCSFDVEETRVETHEEGKYKSGTRKGQPKIVETKITEKVSKIAIVDFKSNTGEKDRKQFYLSHAYQLWAAKKAVEFTYPGISVDMIFNFAPNAWKTQPSFSLKEWSLSEKEIKKFDLYIQLAQVDDLLSPNGNKFIPPTEFKDGVTSNDFKFMSYIEFVENVLISGQSGQSGQLGRQLTTEEVVTEFLGDDESPILTHLNQYEDIEETAGLLVERPQS